MTGCKTRDGTRGIGDSPNAILVLEPIFESELEPEPQAYRPARSALESVRQVERYLRAGHTEVVDTDLSVGRGFVSIRSNAYPSCSHGPRGSVCPAALRPSPRPEGNAESRRAGSIPTPSVGTSTRNMTQNLGHLLGGVPVSLAIWKPGW